MTAIPAGAFTLPFTAEPAHIDELGHVNNAIWVQWIQTLSTSHWAARTGAEEQAAYVWVIVRHEIDYLRPLLEGETVHGRTWVSDRPRGARFDRRTAFTGADGVLHVRAVTTWAMLDRASGRPLRVPSALVDRFLTAID